MGCVGLAAVMQGTNNNYEIDLFKSLIASAQSVSVLIDAESHRPMPLTAEIVSAFQPWLRRGVEIIQPKI